jgi:hypothetical protein
MAQTASYRTASVTFLILRDTLSLILLSLACPRWYPRRRRVWSIFMHSNGNCVQQLEYVLADAVLARIAQHGNTVDCDIGSAMT